MVVGPRAETENFLASLGIEQTTSSRCRSRSASRAIRTPSRGCHTPGSTTSSGSVDSHRILPSRLSRTPRRPPIESSYHYGGVQLRRRFLLTTLANFDFDLPKDVYLIDIPEAHSKVRSRLIAEEDAELAQFDTTQRRLASRAQPRSLSCRATRSGSPRCEAKIVRYTTDKVEKYRTDRTRLNAGLLSKIKANCPDVTKLVADITMYVDAFYNKRGCYDRLDTVVTALFDAKERAEINKESAVNVFGARIQQAADKYGSWVL